MTQDGTQRAAYWRGPGKREWKKIVEGDLLEMAFTPHSVDDLGNLFVSQQEGKEGFSVLKRFDFETMKPSLEPLISTPGFDFTGQLILERGTGAAQGLSVITDAETTLWFDETRKGIQTLVDKVLPGRVNRISCRQCNEPQAVVLVRSYSDQDPGKLFLYRPTPSEGQLQWQPVSAVRDGIDPRAMATVHFKRIKARDGRDLPVWITQPQGVEPGKPAPAIVMVHGGPWTRGGSWAWNPMNQFLASRGYLVIESEFRGSKGYGDAHMKAGWKQWGQAMQDDVADALLWAQQQKLASDKACIAGASYGGYSTLMGLVRHPALYRCGIAWVAVTDLNLLVKWSWWVNDDTSALNRKHTIPEMVGDAQKDAAMLAANSPVLLASQIKSPLLLAFGEEDKRVPIAHGNRMREALQQAHVEPEWVTYPLEAHGWMMQKNKVDFANRMEAFLAKSLK
jgi:dipeptidyl aminopeptidase/acylaminoacyl peptidase